jgi:cytochrome c
MMSGLRTMACTLALAALAGCGQGRDAGDAEAPAAAPQAAQEAPSRLASAPAAFGQCASCHSLEPGRHGIGPSLFAIYGTKAGDIPEYNFSPMLKASGLTWDDATLDRWLAEPMQMVPGTKMTYAGLKDPAKRAEIIAFLKTVK